MKVYEKVNQDLGVDFSVEQSVENYEMACPDELDLHRVMDQNVLDVIAEKSIKDCANYGDCEECWKKFLEMEVDE